LGYEEKGESIMNPSLLTTETHTLPRFDQLSLRDGNCSSELVIVQGDQESITIEAPSHIHARVLTQVLDSTLTISLGGTWLERLVDKLSTSLTRPQIRYRVTLRDLRRLDVFCAARVEAEGLVLDRLAVNLDGAGEMALLALKVEELRVRSAGAGRSVLTGEADSHEVRMSGAGFYDASGLKSRRARVRHSGVGIVRVYADEDLEVDLHGIGTVEYGGHPRLRKRVSGMAAIHPMGRSPK
jgi:hypothetical protein